MVFRATSKTLLLGSMVVLITVMVFVTVWDPSLHFDEVHAGISAPKVRRSGELEMNYTSSWQLPFDPHGNDTMVYIHIHKTGGSAFLEHLVTMQLPVFQKIGASYVRRSPLNLCQMSNSKTWKRGGGFLNMSQSLVMHMELCPRHALNLTGETWLISEKTTGWMCGVHALYVDFVHCLRDVTKYNKHASKTHFPFVSPNRNFHYVTLLRHPILRYLSEYLQTTRGGCWPTHARVCNGKTISSAKNTHPCTICRMKGNKKKLSLEEFLECKHDWRNNRLTLALADSKQVTCWNKTQYTSDERGTLLLESAKRNLLKFAFFGILEFQEESGWLFERTFGVEFGIPPPHLPLNSSLATLLLQTLPDHRSLYSQAINNNRLDLELYWFALKVFRNRMKSIGKDLDKDTVHSLRTLLPHNHIHNSGMITTIPSI